MQAALRLPVLALAIALALPCVAQAGHLTLNFNGVVSAGTGQVFPYEDIAPGLTSFAGEPIAISLGVSQAPSGPYVDAFAVTWSGQTYDLPYITGWSDTGLENTPANESAVAFFSDVSLTGAGGHIRIFPTPAFHGVTNADFDLDLTFAYSSLHDPAGSFVDNAITGGGAFDASLNFVFASIGAYDAVSSGTFALTSVSQTAVPEPSTWALMILGVGAAGRQPCGRRATKTFAAG
jgi:hypothetical protein